MIAGSGAQPQARGSKTDTSSSPFTSRQHLQCNVGFCRLWGQITLSECCFLSRQASELQEPTQHRPGSGGLGAAEQPLDSVLLPYTHPSAVNGARRHSKNSPEPVAPATWRGPLGIKASCFLKPSTDVSLTVPSSLERLEVLRCHTHKAVLRYLSPALAPGQGTAMRLTSVHYIRHRPLHPTPSTW